MKYIVFFILCLYTLPLYAKAKEELIFIINHPGSAPYLYFNEEQNEYQGAIPDLLKPLIESRKLNIKFISNSRKRSEEYIYQGNADLIMLSEFWLKKPEEVIATVPLHQHRSFLYMTEEFPDEFSLENTNESEALCTKDGFFYPNLESHIKSKRLIRIDSSSHLSMLKMLFKHRCKYVVMNEFNALNLINSPFFNGEKLYHSKEPVSTVPLNIILRAELTHVKNILDKHIMALKEKGELQRIIDKHTRYVEL